MLIILMISYSLKLFIKKRKEEMKVKVVIIITSSIETGATFCYKL